MVLLAATAVGVGGYAAYRGGEAAVNAGGRKIEDMKREGRRKEEQRGLNAKARERSTRLTEIENRRNAAKSGSVTASTTSSCLPATAEEKLQKDRLSSIKDRYKEAHGKADKKKKGVFGGMFGKKK